MLNKTQQYILDTTLQFLFDTIKEVRPSFAIKIFEAILTDTVSEDEKQCGYAGVFEAVKQILDILKHPYPQNRSTGSPYVGQEPGYAVYEPNGHGNGIAKEPLGLLSLTARNDDSTEPVKRDDVVNYIITKIKNEIDNLELQKLLHKACELEELPLVSKLLDEGVDPNSNGNYGFKPIHVAAMNGNLELAILLLKAGTDLKQKNSLEESPIHWAAWMGNIKILDYFISLNKDIKLDEANVNGKTALMGAIKGSHIKVVKYLLSKNIHPTEAEMNEVIISGCVTIFKLLIDKTQYDVSLLNRLLIRAVENNRLMMSKYLISLGAEVNLRLDDYNHSVLGGTAFGNSLLHLAVRTRSPRISPDIIRLLIDHGADVNAHVPGGYTPLNSLLCSGIWTKVHDEVSKILLHNRADPNIVNGKGDTALKIFISEYINVCRSNTKQENINNRDRTLEALLEAKALCDEFDQMISKLKELKNAKEHEGLTEERLLEKESNKLSERQNFVFFKVKTLTGKECILKATSEETIEDKKIEFGHKYGVPSSQVCFIYAGQILNSERKVKECIHDQAIIHAVRKPNGGKT